MCECVCGQATYTQAISSVRWKGDKNNESCLYWKKTGIGRHTQTHTTLDFHWSRSHFILCLSDIYLPITPLMLSCDFYPAMYFSVNILHLSAFPLIENHSFNLVSSFWFLSPVRPHKIKVTLTSPARGEFCTKPHVQAHSDPSSREYATIYLLH